MSDAVTAATSPALSPPPGNPRFPLFDGLRAIAVITVLLGHAAFVAQAVQYAWYGELAGNLDIGVTMFFVISGFLLYRPFVSADMDGRRSPTMKAFFRRRLLRIVPAYWFALTVLAIYPGLNGVHSADWWHYYLFLQVYFPGESIQGLGQAWSLCVEMSFYIVLPFYALVLRRLVGGDARRRLRADLVVLTVLGAASIVMRTLVWPHGGMILVWLPSYLFWFTIGMGLAVLSAWVHRTGADPGWLRFTRRRSDVVWAAAIVLFLILGRMTMRGTSGFIIGTAGEFWHFVGTGVVSALVVLPAVFSPRGAGAGAPRRLLGLPVMAWLGLISYGIFLWHQSALEFLWEHGATGWIPAPFAAYTLIGLAVTIPCAAFSYYVVERPFLRLKEPRRPAGGQRRASVSPSSAAVAPTTRSTR